MKANRYRVSMLAVVLVLFTTTPIGAETESQHGYRVLIDGEAVGGMIETVASENDELVTESLMRFRMSAPTGEIVEQVQSRWVEQLGGGLLELSQTSGHSDSTMTLEAVLDEDGWQVTMRGYFGRREQLLEAEKLLGPVAEGEFLHSRLVKPGDTSSYQRFGPAGRPETVRVELIELRDDGVRVIAEAAPGVPSKAHHHIDEQGVRLRTERSLPTIGKWAIERVEPDVARSLIDAIEVEEAPGILETDTEFATGSGIAIVDPAKVNVDQLALLGRVWGYLKYHHPRVTGGELHWDFELFRVLPSVLAANDNAAFQAILVEWIDGLGELSPCDSCATLPEDLHLRPDLDWLADEALLGPELSARLQQVHESRPADAGQFYVNIAPGAGFANFNRELNYPDISLDDDGFRLLTLFRWWNIIEYWFPYRGKIDEVWPAVLYEFLPRLLAAESNDAYRQELLAFGTRIGDGHVFVGGAGDQLPPQGACFLPAGIRFVEDQALVVNVAEAEDEPAETLRFGDVIQAIDGEAVADLFQAWAPYYSASNEPARKSFMAMLMRRGPCEPVDLQVRRNGESLDLQVERSAEPPLPVIHDHPDQTLRILSDRVGYLTLSSFRANEVDDYLEELADTEALIIDIRNYPSESAVFALGQRLVTEPTEFARFTSGVASAPGAFAWTPPISLEPEIPSYQGRIAILVDESSISHAEYTAMAFRVAPDAVVVGSTTAGANGNVSQIPLPGGLGTQISGIGAYYHDKTPMQRVGIVADLPAKPTIAGVRARRDEVLEAALRAVLGDKASEQEIIEMAKRP